MYQYLLFASLLGLGKSGIIDTGSLGDWQHALSLEGGGGGDWQQALSHGGGGSQGLDDGQGHGSPDGSIGGDFHHGVSLVSIGGGGGGKASVFDLTNHGNDAHQGSFGGSFVASSKYSAAGHGDGGHGGQGGGGGGGGGYGVSEGTGFAEHYTSILGASEDVHSGGSPGGHEGLSAYHGSIGGGDEFGSYH
ncbi:unnamed protein product [Psylliodes chrysocephalus]|uniref:Uncharacterized protein n=1 Tax=Psylliodes chrysocephalus TaxID=3402493 RepID=A0A9P0D7S7_9CUCU|nr:unnamed protein product [Psylliodes chrysocephala]